MPEDSTRPLHRDGSPVSFATMRTIRAISCCVCASVLSIRQLYLNRHIGRKSVDLCGTEEQTYGRRTFQSH